MSSEAYRSTREEWRVCQRVLVRRFRGRASHLQSDEDPGIRHCTTTDRSRRRNLSLEICECAFDRGRTPLPETGTLTAS